MNSVAAGPGPTILRHPHRNSQFAIRNSQFAEITNSGGVAAGDYDADGDLELAQRLGHGQSCGAHGGQEPTNESDDQRRDDALHEQVPGHREVEHDLAKAVAVECRYAKPVENDIRERAAEQATDQGQQG